MRVRRTTILESLSRARLQRLASKFGIPAEPRCRRTHLIETIAKCRRATRLALLEALTRAELRAVCVNAGCDPAGRDKATLIARLSDDKSVLLRAHVIASLKLQGFHLKGQKIALPEGLDKEGIRRLHVLAVQHKREKAKSSLMRLESELITRIANGSEVTVSAIHPRLIEVTRGSFEELLFRYACLHWTIPVSSGYGRRLRFLVVDDSNDKLIGVLGLGDPVFALRPRDSWIGWHPAMRSRRLHNVLDAFVLGAVPPYSFLLGGKLVAMLAASNHVRDAFRAKYAGKETLISRNTTDGEVVLLTTTSALGRSSIYNRLTFQQRRLYQSVGFTRGFGEFQFLNGLYDELSSFAHTRCTATAKNEAWGTGFRNRREVVKKCLAGIGLSSDLLCHGVHREVFVVSMADNTKEYLCGRTSEIHYCDRPSDALFADFRTRWLLPRARRDDRYAAFSRDAFRLWDS